MSDRGERSSDGRTAETGAGHRGLSEDDRDALRLALERGYFEVPRETTLTHLAEELGVPSSEVSERLRRGVRDLLGDAEVMDV